MSKVSVIIPVYNAEKYLRECLDSVIAQTLKDIEIICINDGSTDNSLLILSEYASKDPRIKVINKKNEGVGKTRNAGIKAANGKFVAFMDPDDVYPTNDILEVLYNEAINHNVLICGGEFSVFTDENKNFSQQFCQSDLGYLFSESKVVDYKDYQFDYGYHRFIYNRLFLLKNNIFYPNYKRFQDPPFFTKAMVKAGKFYGIKKITYGYRCGHQNVTWTQDKILDLFRGINDNFKIAKKYNCKTLSDYTYIRLQQHFTSIDKNNINFKALFLLNNMPKYNPDVKGFLEEHKLRLLQDKIIDNIKERFYVKNIGCHKVFCLFDIKIKIKSKKLIRQQQGVPEIEYSFFERLFSVKNSDIHKVITILGMKYKIKSKKLKQKRDYRNSLLEKEIKLCKN